MHQKAKEREDILQRENKELKAKVRLRERQLFGGKSEQSKGGSESQEGEENPKRKRGQPWGAPGHGRKLQEDLPVKDEVCDLPEEEKFCPCCGLPFSEFPGTEESEIVEIEVRPYVRRIIRRKYKPTCACPNLPTIITVPGPTRLIPKGGYGDSIWIEVLVDKYLHFRPTSRLLESFELRDLNISQGTITGGLKTLSPLFEPVYEGIVLRSQKETHWHADETRWMVFAPVEGKTGYRWYLWVFKSESAVVFILDQSRSSKVPLSHLKDVNHECILSVDRYSAYKCLAKEKDGCIVLAWCWSHVRRDFINLSKDRPEHEVWAMGWVEQIGLMYRLNARRLEVIEDSEAFEQRDEDLRGAAEGMEQNFREQLKDEKLSPDRRKILQSLENHWDGLTVFIEHPEIPMDNNPAERVLRGPVSGRKTFYGSGSVWSGYLMTMMFTVFQTLLQWEINPRTWLQRFFRACAENGGKPLDDISPFLPWNMDEQELEFYRRPDPDYKNSS